MECHGGIQSGETREDFSYTSAMCPPPSRTVTRRCSFSMLTARRPRYRIAGMWNQHSPTFCMAQQNMTASKSLLFQPGRNERGYDFQSEPRRTMTTNTLSNRAGTQDLIDA